MNNKVVKFISGDRQLYQKFKTKHVIGTGNSIVYEVVDQEKNIECVKEIRLEDKQSQFIFRKEIQLLNKIKNNPHPNIVQYRGSYCLQDQKKGQSNFIKKGYIQMQRGIANLKTYLSQRKQHFQQEDIIIFISTMIEVFAHLQKSEVAHRDIKPSNILLFSEDPLYFKVCDVGAGTAVGFCDHTKQMTVIGTPYYLSPELYKAHRQKKHEVNYKAYKSDTYSLGLLFLQFCSLKKIQERLNNEPKRIQNAIKEIKELYPNIIGLGKILRKMLDMEVTSRMDFIQLEKYIFENNLLRNKISKTITLDSNMFGQIIEKNEIIIDKLEGFNHLQALVSTQNNISKLKITISSVIDKSKQGKDYRQDLINIKYMKLKQLYLTLEMCNIKDKHVLLVAQALQKNKNLNILHINFWNNQITNHGFIALVKSIKQNLSDLKELHLNFSSNQIRVDQNINNFFDLGDVKGLTHFDLNLGFNEIKPDFMPELFRQISRNKDIRSLSINLQNTKLTPVHFGRAVKQLYIMENIENLSINVSCSMIREEGIYSIADLCPNLPKLTHCRFVLRNSQISDKGFMQLIKTLSKRPQLKQVKLNFMNNQITQKSMKSGSPFLQILQNVQFFDLNLSNNKLTDLAFKYLCNSILVNKSLTKLRLVFDMCGLTQKGCLYIGRLISQQPKLQDLDISIRSNDIKFQGVQYICAGLIHVKKIKRIKINLEGTLIGDYAANYLASCLLKLRYLTLVDLNLQNCNLSSQTMSNIVKAVQECCQSTEEITIDMRKNKDVKKQLIDQLKKQMQNRKVAIKVDSGESSFLTA